MNIHEVQYLCVHVCGACVCARIYASVDPSE